MNIRGTTQLVGLLGWPVEHSLSPPMHNAAFGALGLDWVYVAMPTPPERIGEAVRGLHAVGFKGFNCTIPHKESVMAHLDTVMPEAQAIGAVNTVVVNEGQLIGHNTDVDGFVTPVHDEAGIDLAGKSAVVLGAGGAARALAVGCVRLGVSGLTLTDIELDRAERLAKDLAQLPDCPAVKILHAKSDEVKGAVGEAALVANATPIGMHGPDECPVDPTWLPDGVAVFDAVYTQPQTALMRAATERGGVAVHGLRMLLHQGAKAFELWTGKKPDVEVMERALEEARH